MAQFATWHLNGVCIPISSSSTASEIEYFVKNSECDMVVCHSDFKKRFESVKEQLGIPIYHLDDADTNLMCKSLLSKHGKESPLQ